MAITLSRETQELVEATMKDLGFDNADDFIQQAIRRSVSGDVADFDDLDDETRAAIEMADQQESVPWEEAKAQILSTFGK